MKQTFKLIHVIRYATITMWLYKCVDCDYELSIPAHVASSDDYEHWPCPNCFNKGEKMGRTYYGKTNKGKLHEFAEKNGANYITDELDDSLLNAIWWKKIDGEHPAIRLDEDGDVQLGRIDPDCENYENRSGYWLRKKSLVWAISVLNKIKNYKG